MNRPLSRRVDPLRNAFLPFIDAYIYPVKAVDKDPANAAAVRWAVPSLWESSLARSLGS